MSREMPSEYELDAIEHKAAVEAAQINGALGEVPTEEAFEFCPGCPMLNGHDPSEVADAEEQITVTYRMGVEFTGSIIKMALQFKDGSKSKSMLLDVFPYPAYTGRMAKIARAEAVQETKACSKPQSIPPLLGPFAVKRCRALRKSRD